MLVISGMAVAQAATVGHTTETKTKTTKSLDTDKDGSKKVIKYKKTTKKYHE